MTTGELIRKMRRRAGLTQVQLAAAIPVDPSTVSRWERGEAVPDLHHLRDAARAMNCSLSDFDIDSISHGA